MPICKFCTREFKNAGGHSAHEPYCELNPNRVRRTTGSIPWNKGLVGDDRCKHSEETKGKLKGKNKGSAGIAKTPEKEIERRKKISEKAKSNNGGYRMGSGRGKKGWYKGFFCDSSYELAYLIYCLDHNIDIKRNTEKRTYVWEGAIRNYVPDFIVDGELVEIKGFVTEQWLAKLDANPDITVLYGSDLKEVFDYVNEKYGKDFVNMYE